MGGADVDLCNMAPAKAWSTSFLESSAWLNAEAPQPLPRPIPDPPPWPAEVDEEDAAGVPVTTVAPERKTDAVELLAALEDSDALTCATSKPGERDRPLGSPPFEVLKATCGVREKHQQCSAVRETRFARKRPRSRISRVRLELGKRSPMKLFKGRMVLRD